VTSRVHSPESRGGEGAGRRRCSWAPARVEQGIGPSTAFNNGVVSSVFSSTRGIEGKRGAEQRAPNRERERAEQSDGGGFVSVAIGAGGVAPVRAGGMLVRAAVAASQGAGCSGNAQLQRGGRRRGQEAAPTAWLRRAWRGVLGGFELRHGDGRGSRARRLSAPTSRGGGGALAPEQ